MRELPANVAGIMAMTATTQAAVGVQNTNGTAEILHAISTIIGSIGSLIWIIYLYRSKFNNPNNPKDPPTPPTSPLMLLLVSVTLAGLLAVGGCRATPERRLVIARQTYTAALTAAADLRAAGKMTDANYAKVEQARTVAAGAIRLLEIDAAAQKQPDTTTLQKLEQSVGVIVDTVKEIYAGST